jgi:Flp pilus assembly pilin Flp
MKALMKKFWKDEAGLEMVEYAVLAGLIVAAIVVTIALLRDAIMARFTALITALNS